ncbi:hypothetical protein COD67_05615 [Bacillus cereus]|nr:hypothetical protein COI89_19930 [Bacillus cereus]PGU68987.1 hypothetical protein COD67_05615 [Bacillus cereus]
MISNQIVLYNQKDIYLQQIEIKRSGCYEKLCTEIRPIFSFSFSFSYEGTRAFAFVPFLLRPI